MPQYQAQETGTKLKGLDWNQCVNKLNAKGSLYHYIIVNKHINYGMIG